MCGSPKKDFFTSTVALYATNIALFPPTFALPLGNKVRLVTIKNLFKAWLTGLIDYALGSNIRRDRSTSPHAPCRRRWKYNKLIRFVNKKIFFKTHFSTVIDIDSFCILGLDPQEGAAIYWVTFFLFQASLIWPIFTVKCFF